MANKYTHRYTINANDMDNWYRLTPNAILLYFQDCYARYMAHLNIAAFDLVKEKKMWVITEFNAELTDNEAFWSEEIDVTLWISEISPLRIYADFCITKDGKIISFGNSCWSILNTESHRIEKTDFLLKNIEICDEKVMGDHKKVRFPQQGFHINNIRHSVNLLDLDFNGHVNNRSYISIAMLTATDEFIATHSVKRFYVHWKQETYFKEELVCDLYSVDENFDINSSNEFVHILSKNEGSTVAEIYTVWKPVTQNTDVSEIVHRQ